MNPIRPEDLFAPEFTGNIDKIVESLKSAVQTLTNEIEKVKKAASTLASTPIATNQAESTRKWAESVGTLNAQYKALLKDYGLIYNELQEVTTVQRDQNQILKLQSQYAEAADNSFNKMSAEYRLLKIAANALDPSLKENAKNIERIIARLAELHEEMNVYQKSTGKATMQVGDYTRALNGLNLSTQQILREMPTLANSTSQFFMAISNNVPIFIDNFKRARQELGSFSAALKGTLSAIMSWQTVLLVILTVLPKVAKAIHDKKKAQEEANKETEKSIVTEKTWYEGLQKVAENEIRAATEARTLLNISKDATRSDEERAAALQRLNELYPDNAGKIEEYVKHLELEAKAKAIVAQITELQIKLMQKEFLINDKIAEVQRLRNVYEEKRAQVGQKGSYTKQLREVEKAYNAMAEAGAGISEIVQDTPEIKKQIKDWQDALSQLITDPALTISGGGKGRNKKEREENIGEVKDFTLRYYDAIIEGMEEGVEKQLMVRWREGYKIREEYKADMDKLKEQELLAEKKKDSEVLALIRSRMAQRRAVYIQEIKNLPTVQEIEEKYAEKVAKDDPLAEVRGAYWDALREMRDYTFQIQVGLDEGRKIGTEELADWQEIIRKKVEAEAEFQKAKKELELKGMLEAGQISQTEYEQRVGIAMEEIDAAARKSIDKIGRKREKRWNLWVALFGTDRKDETTGTITRELGEDVKYALDQTMNAYKTATKYIDEYIDALSRAAQQAIETANTEVDMARKVYEAELEARANGYANAVDTARMEYEQKLQMQKKAQEESAKIQKTQLAMESASQAASLLTATANILASYSKLPVIGQALAIAGIATMWTTFLAAKVKAGQVTKYGEGMSEYLDYGGSHASGHDIDFGVTPDGRRRRVERGEVIGVINKRNVRRYGASTVTGIIDSLNKGNFEYKYGNAFTPAIVAGGRSADLHKLESGVDALVRQGEYREVRDGDKRIIQYKNLTRIIR